MGELFYSLELESLTITQNKECKMNSIPPPKYKTLLHGKKHQKQMTNKENIFGTLYHRELVSLKYKKLLRQNRTCSEKKQASDEHTTHRKVQMALNI